MQPTRREFIQNQSERTIICCPHSWVRLSQWALYAVENVPPKRHPYHIHRGSCSWRLRTRPGFTLFATDRNPVLWAIRTLYYRVGRTSCESKPVVGDRARRLVLDRNSTDHRKSKNCYACFWHYCMYFFRSIRGITVCISFDRFVEMAVQFDSIHLQFDSI